MGRRAFSAAQVPSGWYASTDSEPSEDAAASSSPSSCGANATPFTDALCTGAEYTCTIARSASAGVRRSSTRRLCSPWAMQPTWARVLAQSEPNTCYVVAMLWCSCTCCDGRTATGFGASTQRCSEQAGGGVRTGVQVFSGASFHTITRWSKLQEASRLPNLGCAQVTCRGGAARHAPQVTFPHQ